MKVIFTEKNMTAPVRSAINRMSRKGRRWEGVNNSPEDFCNRLLESQLLQKQK